MSRVVRARARIIRTRSGEVKERAGEPMTNDGDGTERKFHGWRLLGVCALVVVMLAVISALVDWWVIGPLEGRVF